MKPLSSTRSPRVPQLPKNICICQAGFLNVRKGMYYNNLGDKIWSFVKLLLALLDHRTSVPFPASSQIVRPFYLYIHLRRDQFLLFLNIGKGSFGTRIPQSSQFLLVVTRKYHR